MHIVRYLPPSPDAGPQVGVLHEDGALGRLPVRSLGELLGYPFDEIREATGDTRPESPDDDESVRDPSIREPRRRLRGES